MGVYIKDMEMPQNCEECDLKVWDEYDSVDYVCPFSGVIVLNIGRQGSCPLIEVPPHGRLIDADKLRKAEFIHDGDAYAVVMSRDIEQAPTIIPAEEGE